MKTKMRMAWLNLRRYFAFVWRALIASHLREGGGGRHDSLRIVRCGACDHRCLEKDCAHTYQDDGDGDVEPVDECPRCGSGDTEPADWKPVPNDSDSIF